jgi:hypothetical protein
MFLCNYLPKGDPYWVKWNHKPFLQNQLWEPSASDESCLCKRVLACWSGYEFIFLSDSCIPYADISSRVLTLHLS